MKKIIISAFMIAATLSLSACGNADSQVDQVLSAQTTTEVVTPAAAVATEVPAAAEILTEAAPEQDAAATETTAARSADGIDIDLAGLSGTMAYAEVYNMMMDPESYIGKTIRVSGQYNAAFLEPRDDYYHYVLIKDALACCESGLEFIWDNDEHTYPDEYPENGAEIEFTGTFDKYEEDGYEYLYIAANNLTVK